MKIDKRRPAHWLLLAGFLTRRFGQYLGTGQVAMRETLRSLDEWEGVFIRPGCT